MDAEGLRNLLGPKRVDDILNGPAFRVPEPLDLGDYDIPEPPTAEHAERQLEQGDRQLQILAALQELWQAQAAETAANVEREAKQQRFNKVMALVAAGLAGAAVVVPFVVLWIEQAAR